MSSKSTGHVIDTDIRSISSKKILSRSNNPSPRAILSGQASLASIVIDPLHQLNEDVTSLALIDNISPKYQQTTEEPLSNFLNSMRLNVSLKSPSSSNPTAVAGTQFRMPGKGK
jgi:hypothetical protein